MRTQNKTLQEYLAAIKERNRLIEVNKEYLKSLRAMGVMVFTSTHKEARAKRLFNDYQKLKGGIK